MANPKYVQEVGNLMSIVFDDGSKAFAYPTTTKKWLVKNYISGGGTTDPAKVSDITITNCENTSLNITGNRKKWAVSIYNSAQSLNLTSSLKRRAGIAALMTALVESVLLMYANSNVPDSLNYTHDAVGSDHDSLGLMQQRPSAGWGSVAELMNAGYNTLAFFGGPSGPNGGSPRGLLDISGWETGDLGAHCQSVQVSAFPDRYSCWEAGATQLYDHIAASANTGGGSGFMYPFPASAISSPYGPRSGGTGSFHEGTDFGAGAVGGTGTPIPAIGGGTVQEKRYHANFGNMVIINHGILSSGTYAGKRARSLYAHMDAPGPLSVGGSVKRGATVGPIGNTGASQGAHLHLEIHITEPNSGIVWNTTNDGGYRSAVNPETFLNEYA